MLRALFGQLHRDGTRQYRTALIEIPRKNGKTQLAAAFALYLLFADGEPGAEVYSAAADKDQARLVFGEAKRMLEASPLLLPRAQVFKDAILVPETQSVYRVLSADAPTKHGLNPHGVVVDELHAHKSRELWDVLTTAQGTRRQPLTVAITTAGHDRQSICYELHAYGRRIREGLISDPSFYSVYFGAPEAADWTDRKVWKRANPALGDFLSDAFLENEFTQAAALPARQNAFRQLYLNQWVQQATRWIDLTLWDANAGHAVTEASLQGRTCYGGLDLAAVSDLTAWVLLFPCEDDEGGLDVLARFWVPEAQLERSKNAALYRQWVDAEILQTTPGDAIDYGFIKAQVLKDAQTFDLIDLNVDRLFQGQQLSTDLSEEGLQVFPMGQGFASMAAPMVEFERRLRSRQLHHGGHPILRWMADNVVVKPDPAGNLKIDKAKSQEKVDGIVAMVMALDRVTRHSDDAGATAYDDGGVFIV